MTDARTLLDWSNDEDCGSEGHKHSAICAAAAEADTLRERVAALEGAARRVTSAQVYEAPGDPCQGLDVGFVRALRLLYEVVTSPAPTPATDEARCDGFHDFRPMTCSRCGVRGNVNLSIVGEDERLDITKTQPTPEPAPMPPAVAYGSIPGSDDWVMADPEPGS